jgi:multiple sugar transport system substrate-binding protein
MRTQRSKTTMWLALFAMLALLLAACGGEVDPGAPEPGDPADTPDPAATPDPGDNGEVGEVVMLSTQLVPVEEAEAMRNVILADFPGQVDFIGEEEGPFIDRVIAEAQAGSGEVGVLGALHGHFAALDPEYFVDLTDLADELAAHGIPDSFLELGRLGTDRQIYIPWMQATYIMAARVEALDYLPDGADLDNLTWEQVGEWGRNIMDETGQARLGFPAGEDGLLHRFFQGYGYPSFTGGVNTTFRSPAAVEMWEWLQDTWQYVNPQSTTYGFMQDPLQTGEVWVAWDHTARLIDALRADPDGYVAFASPSGPEGRGFMPVLAGLAIPETAPDQESARELIRHLLQPETQVTTLEQVAFFPVVDAADPGELDQAIAMEQEAVASQSGADDALPSLLPVGLGGLGGEYNKVFQDSFRAIILDGGDASEVLEREAENLQAVLDEAEAECWPPDPESDGVCQVE